MSANPSFSAELRSAERPFRPAPLSTAILPAACLLYFLIRYQSPGYFAGGLAVLIGHHFLLSGRLRIERLPIGSALLILAGMLLPALGAWQFLHLRDLGDMDHAAYATAFWNLRQANLHYAMDGNNMFGIHSQYTAVVWIPVHWLGGELGLKMGKGVCLIAACLLMVNGLRKSREAAAWGALSLLLAPQVASQFFFGFHPEILAAPVLVLSLRAYRDGKLLRFLLCAAFLAYTKEVLTLAVGGILLVALVERRPWKWILLPGLLCCVQMALYWFVILPRFAPEGNLLAYFLPRSLSEIGTLWLRPQNLFYALHVFLPFLPLTLAFPKRYLLLPLPLMAFYAAFPDPLFVGMWTNYAFPTAFLCAAGLLLQPGLRISWPAPFFSNPPPINPASDSPIGSASLTGGPPDAKIPPAMTLDGRILAACATLSLLSYPLWREPFSIPLGNLDRSREVDRLQALIPKESPVIVNGPVLARFAARREIASWGYRKKPLSHFEYAVIETALPFWQFSPEQRYRSADSLSKDPAWTREYAQDGLYLFRRNPETRP